MRIYKTFLKGLLPLFLFFLGCSRAPDLTAEEISMLYAERVLLYKKGYDGCYEFVRDFGFYINQKGQKVIADKAFAQDFCKYYENPLRQVGYKNAEVKINEIENKQTADGRWVAQYELVFKLPMYDYTKNLTFEKIGGRWRVYLIKM